MSSTVAPAATCAMASASTREKSPRSSSSFRILRPVGLIRSPITQNGSSKPITVVLVLDSMTVRVMWAALSWSGLVCGARAVAAVLGGPFGIGLDAAEREEVDAFDIAGAAIGLGCGKISQDLGRLGRPQQLGDIAGALLKHRQGCTEATGDGELYQGLKLCRAGDAQVHRHRDARRGKPFGPSHDRRRLEGELGGDGEFRIRPVGEILFPPQRGHHLGVTALGVDVTVAFGVACDMQMGKACIIEQPGFQKLHRRMELTLWRRDAAARTSPCLTSASP